MRAKHTIQQTEHKNKDGGHNYIYLPRPNDQLSGDAKKFNDNRVKEGKGVYIILRHHAFGKPLKCVKNNDRLYVYGHANLGEGIGPHNKGLNPKALAKRLKSDGLDPSIKCIKLLACNTGRVMPNHDKSFAQRVANELGALDYNDIIVVGYLGFVTITNQSVSGKFVQSHLKRSDLTEDLPEEFLYPPLDGDDSQVRMGRAKEHRQSFKPEFG